ncbi:MAG: hypothetical protein AB1801_09005 [Chloroflexota bacterium]
MFKKRVLSVLTGLALLAAVAGSTGIVADWLGWAATTPAHACNEPGGAGGGC